MVSKCQLCMYPMSGGHICNQEAAVQWPSFLLPHGCGHILHLTDGGKSQVLAGCGRPGWIEGVTPMEERVHAHSVYSWKCKEGSWIQWPHCCPFTSLSYEVVTDNLLFIYAEANWEALWKGIKHDIKKHSWHVRDIAQYRNTLRVMVQYQKLQGHCFGSTPAPNSLTTSEP